MGFIPNVGQIDEAAIRFSVKNQGHTIFFTPSEVVFDFSPIKKRNAVSEIIRLQFFGANPTPEIESLDPLPGVVNIFRGDVPTRWQTGLPTYGAIVYRNLYPGIDLVYSGETRAFKSEFIVAPQADPADIRLAYTGVEGLQLRSDGALALVAAHGELVETAPVVCQEIAGRLVSVEGDYQLLPDGQVGFRLGAYDPDYPLIIDPTIVYGSYFGGGPRSGATPSPLMLTRTSM